MNLDILDKFTTHLRNTLSRSIDLAWELKKESIPPLFLLFSLSEQKDSIAAEILRKNNLVPEELEAYVAEYDNHGSTANDGILVHTETTPASTSGEAAASSDGYVFLWPEFSRSTKQLIERAAVLAFEYQHQFIGTEHLLLALIEASDADVDDVFSESATNQEQVKKQILKIMKSAPKQSEFQSFLSSAQQPQDINKSEVAVHDIPEEGSDTPALDYFGIDLTAEENIKKLDPVVGRADEIERLIHILSRRTKNNPVLIGEPGVGKTAIAEGLAKRIAEGQVPDILLHKRIIALDLSLLLAGTMYRGEFESRLKQIIEELKHHPDIVLFIDEIHTIVGAGGVSGGTLDAANILKPALAKGSIRCIGATTSEEYRKFIEHDSALERRFQPILVDEPTEEETVEILTGLCEYYEQYHHVEISQDVIQAAIQFSVRYIPEKRLPDKAIDLIDEAGAKIHAQRRVPAVLRTFEKHNSIMTKLRQQKEMAVRTERFQLAVDLKKKESELTAQLQELHKKVKKIKTPVVALSEKDIAEVVAAKTHIPLEQILISTRKKYKKLDEEIKKYIVGQDDAIAKVAHVIKRSYAGLTTPHQPLGSFIFLGPSGVGKTELAKVLAKTVFGDRNALIRLDMSEFTESFTLSKLIGAPAGYVGYNERVKLSDQIRQKPYSVVLFDEIEKAHPDVFNILLQILDEGRLTDSTGHELNFCNSVIILTSNIGMEMLNKQAAIGFEESDSKQEEPTFEEIESETLEELKSYFPPEFLNRINHHIVFRPLALKDMEKIVEMKFVDIQELLRGQNVQVHMLKSARTHIAKKSFDPEQGARLVAKTLSELVGDRLADMILSGTCTAGDSIKVKVQKDAIVLVKEKQKKK